MDKWQEEAARLRIEIFGPDSSPDITKPYFERMERLIAAALEAAEAQGADVINEWKLLVEREREVRHKAETEIARLRAEVERLTAAGKELFEANERHLQAIKDF